MPRLQNTPSELSRTESGYSVVKCDELTNSATQIVLQHISWRLTKDFAHLHEAAVYIVENCFPDFMDKPARILPEQLACRMLEELEANGFLTESNSELITDEENLGYPNVYWRIVRPNHLTDVGPVHADKWFWDLGDASVPDTYERTKIWLPLLQDDRSPSLRILPGSQKIDYQYEIRIDKFGKRKPSFHNESVSKSMVPAPVSIGEAIIFHDRLLHGGQTTGSIRVSMEWTLAHPT